MKAFIALLIAAFAIAAATACGSEPKPVGRVTDEQPTDTATFDASTNAPRGDVTPELTTASGTGDAPATPAASQDGRPTAVLPPEDKPGATPQSQPSVSMPTPTEPPPTAVPQLDDESSQWVIHLLRRLDTTEDDPAMRADALVISSEIKDRHPHLVQAWLMRAQNLIYFHHYQQAVDDLTIFLSDDGPAVDDRGLTGQAHALQAAALARLGRLDEATAAIALARSSPGPITRAARSVVDYHSGNYERLYSDYVFHHPAKLTRGGPSQLAIDLLLNPDDQDLISRMAQAHYWSGEYRLALEMLARLTDRTPDQLFLQARLHTDLHQLDEALDALADLPANHPITTGYDFQYMMGTVHAKAGRHNEAEPHFRKALELYPQYYEASLADNKRPESGTPHQASYALAYAQVLRGEMPNAFDPQCNVGDTSTLSFKAGIVCLKRSRLAAATAYLSPYAQDNAWLYMLRAISARPEITANADPGAGHNLEFLFWREDPIAAYYFTRAIELDPSITAAYIGRCLTAPGNHPQAERYCAEALEADPDSIAMHDRMARLLKGRQTEQAIAHIDELIRLSPQDAAALHFMRGEYHARARNTEAATADFLAARDLGHPEEEVRQALLQLTQ